MFGRTEKSRREIRCRWHKTGIPQESFDIGIYVIRRFFSLKSFLVCVNLVELYMLYAIMQRKMASISFEEFQIRNKKNRRMESKAFVHIRQKMRRHDFNCANKKAIVYEVFLIACESLPRKRREGNVPFTLRLMACDEKRIFYFNWIDDAYGYYATRLSPLILHRTFFTEVPASTSSVAGEACKSVLCGMKLRVSFNGSAASVERQSPRHDATFNRHHFVR